MYYGTLCWKRPYLGELFKLAEVADFLFEQYVMHVRPLDGNDR